MNNEELDNNNEEIEEEDIDIEAYKAEILAKVRRSTNKMLVHPTNKDPMDRPFGSWFAHIGVLKKGESWPTIDDLPLFPLCQINTAELPYLPPILEGIAMVCVWLYPWELKWERGNCNGTGWVLRSYSSLSDLVPTNYFYPRYKKQEPEPSFLWQLFTSQLRHWTHYVPPALIEWELADDYPHPALVENILNEDEHTAYRSMIDKEGIEEVDVSKVGGWPYLNSFTPFEKHPFVDFVFQISSYTKLGWGWFSPKDGDGYGYFGQSRFSKDWVFDRFSWWY